MAGQRHAGQGRGKLKRDEKFPTHLMKHTMRLGSGEVWRGNV